MSGTDEWNPSVNPDEGTLCFGRIACREASRYLASTRAKTWKGLRESRPPTALTIWRNVSVIRRPRQLPTRSPIDADRSRASNELPLARYDIDQDDYRQLSWIALNTDSFPTAAGRRIGACGSRLCPTGDQRDSCSTNRTHPYRCSWWAGPRGSGTAAQGRAATPRQPRHPSSSSGILTPHTVGYLGPRFFTRHRTRRRDMAVGAACTADEHGHSFEQLRCGWHLPARGRLSRRRAICSVPTDHRG